MQPEPTFDIFRGTFADKNAMWVEAVNGLTAARERMEVIAAEQPGAYFLFSSMSHAVLAIVNTTPKPVSTRSNKAGAA
jgi:hypothetical protein